MEGYQTRATRVARATVDHCKDAEVAVADVVGYICAIYANQKYQDGFAEARRMFSHEYVDTGDGVVLKTVMDDG